MRFLVMFEGRNFEGAINEQRGLLGFYANRRIDAPSIELLNTDETVEGLIAELKQIGINATKDSVVRVERASLFQAHHEDMAKGFSFFPESSGLRRFIERMIGR